MKEWGQLPLRGQETSSSEMTAEQEEPFSDIQHLSFFPFLDFVFVCWNQMTWQLSHKTIFRVVFSLLVKTDKCHAPAQHGRVLMELSREATCCNCLVLILNWSCAGLDSLQNRDCFECYSQAGWDRNPGLTLALIGQGCPPAPEDGDFQGRASSSGVILAPAWFLPLR